jgi:hypothetical protein
MRLHTSLLLSVATLVGAASAQRFIQLPDNHNLGESATQAHAGGTANFWGGATVTGRRFQILYDASHFTGLHGVTGPMTIQYVRFRGEDTEHNAGGQTYTNVTASIYSTTATSAVALSTTFANNIPPVNAGATLLGTITVPTLVVAPSIGRAPNNDNITLDFTSVLPVFDPTGPQPNFLIDISYTAAAVAPDPQGSSMVAMQDTSGTTAFIRGRGLFAANAAALTGTASTTPLTMRIEYAGPGGYPGYAVARNELYGAACGGSASAFYQLFAHGTYFDLKDPGQVDGLSGLRMIPDVYPNPTVYTVTGGAAAVDLVNGLGAAPISQADDATVAFPLTLGNFEYVGGPAGGTNQIRPSTNGYVILDPTSTETGSDFSPTVAEFLGSAATHLARLAPFWHDFSPNKNTAAPFGDPLSGLHAVENGPEILVTWYRVGRFNSVVPVFQEEHTMQVSMHRTTGIIEFRYGSMGEIWGDTSGGTTSGIVGFTRGRISGVSSVDPQSRDLSIERPFTTKVEGATSNMGQTIVATPVVGGAVYGGRLFPGQTVRYNVNNVPAGSIIGAQLLDITPNRPGLQTPMLTVPGCILSTTTDPLIVEVHVSPGATITGTHNVVAPAGYLGALVGAEVYAQYVVLDGLFGGPDLITVASNAIKSTLGLN